MNIHIMQADTHLPSYQSIHEMGNRVPMTSNATASAVAETITDFCLSTSAQFRLQEESRRRSPVGVGVAL
jgi:ABC-type uncharacterized transport system YnjBCD substrate-binding protein